MAGKKSVATNPDGRKKHIHQKYDPDYHPQNYTKLAELGMSNIQIAKFFEVSRPTMAHDWVNRYPEFAKAFSEGTMNLEQKLKSALVRKAIGFDYEERKTTTENGIETKVEVTEKVCLPDANAALKALGRYNKEFWGDKEAEKDESAIGKIEIEVVTSANSED
tara:strand:+ start:2379 stop:2867 length:489 start_codon:yes stop_codon:yes gene_type:complete